jgi:hypothetical protein
LPPPPLAHPSYTNGSEGYRLATNTINVKIVEKTSEILGGGESDGPFPSNVGLAQLHGWSSALPIQPNINLE